MLTVADVISRLLDERLARNRITLLFDPYCRLLRDAGLGNAILLSAEIRRRLAEQVRPRGAHAFKGVPGLTEVFAP